MYQNEIFSNKVRLFPDSHFQSTLILRLILDYSEATLRLFWGISEATLKPIRNHTETILWLREAFHEKKRDI